MTIKKLISQYYNNPNNLVLIAKGLFNRETCLLNPNGRIIRCIKAQTPIYLKKNLDHYKIELNNYNIYRSVAYYKDFPMFSWKKEFRQAQYNAWTFNKIYMKHVYDYDYYIDFDSEGLKDEDFVRDEVSETSRFLTVKGVNHLIYSSGSGYYIKAVLKDNKTPEHAKKITLKLVKDLGLTSPDLSIYKWQSVIKAPYTIDVKTMNICTPIKPDMFSCFNKEQTNLANNRGITHE